MKFNLVNNSGKKLSDEYRNELDKMISIDEIYDGMMTLKTGRVCPGSDGFGRAFYHKFWSVLKVPLYSMYQEAMQKGILGATARRGIINLIPKKSKNKLLVKNWRPITLLNFDYKIWAKCIANRLDIVSRDLIGHQQFGFVRGRSIFGNIRRTAEVLSHLNKAHLPGIIIQIDFKKCFDRVEFNSIKKTFEYFGFGVNFVKMLSLLYSKLEMCTINNGFVSKYLDKTRGTNQGCPASPLVYTYCGEILAHLLLHDPNIHGLDLNGVHNVLAQFTDDTSVYLKFERLCVNTFINILTCVEEQMGLKVSYDKTTIYKIGSLAHSDATIYTRKNFKWSNDPIETLGVTIDLDGTGNNEANFKVAMQKMRGVCSTWYNRNLTLFGKALVINSLMGSLFVYKLSSVLDINNEQVQEYNKIVRDFIWQGKYPKIALTTLQKSKEQGGIKVMDIVAKQDSLLINWIFKLEEDPVLCECAYQILSPYLRNMIWNCNLDKKAIIQYFKDIHNFWVCVLLAWSKIHYVEPQSKVQVLNQFIWLNTHIRINNEVIEWKEWIEKSILDISDLYNGTRFKTSQELNVQWLQLWQIIQSIPVQWRQMLESENDGCSVKDVYRELLTCTLNRSKRIYNMLISDDKQLNKYARCWIQQGLSELTQEDYVRDFDRLYKITKERDFQYRLLLGKIICNSDLFDWHKLETDRCTFCGKERETMLHVFYECEELMEILEFFNELCVKESVDSPSRIAFVFNRIHDDCNHVLNWICIVLKQFIYKRRCGKQKPMKMLFELELKSKIRMEKHIAERKGSVEKFTRKWSPILYLAD